MGWQLTSLIAMLSFSGQFLCFRRLQRTYAIQVYLFYAWFGAAFFFGIIFLRSGVTLTLDLLLVLILTGFVSWFGNYAYNVGISKQPNLGYVEAVASIRIIILYCASLAFLGAQIELLKLVAMLGIVVGILLVVGRGKTESRASDTLRIGGSWIVWTGFAGIMFALLAASNRFVNERGIEPPTALFFWLLTATLLYGGSSIVRGHSLRPVGDVHILILAIVFTIIGNAALFGAYSTTSNLAYPTVINNSRMVLLYSISVMLGFSKLETVRALGVIITFLSVVLIYL